MKYLSIFLGAFFLTLSFSTNTSSSDVFHYSPIKKVKTKSELDLEINFAIQKLESLNSIEKPNDYLCNIKAFDALTKKQKEIISSAIKDIPCIFLLNLLEVKVFQDKNKPRAMTNGYVLYIREDLFDLPEATNIIIHEFAHIIDISYFDSIDFSEKSNFKDGNMDIFLDDLSVNFYSISWKNNTEWKTTTKQEDFLSTYARTDPFEDFADAFLYYVKNGENFRNLIKDNKVLEKKYNFIKNNIFGGKEFFTGNYENNLTNYYDISKNLAY